MAHGRRAPGPLPLSPFGRPLLSLRVGPGRHKVIDSPNRRSFVLASLTSFAAVSSQRRPTQREALRYDSLRVVDNQQDPSITLEAEEPLPRSSTVRHSVHAPQTSISRDAGDCPSHQTASWPPRLAVTACIPCSHFLGCHELFNVLNGFKESLDSHSACPKTGL